jgi:hypothetical protein
MKCSLSGPYLNDRGECFRMRNPETCTFMETCTTSPEHRPAPRIPLNDADHVTTVDANGVSHTAYIDEEGNWHYPRIEQQRRGKDAFGRNL